MKTYYRVKTIIRDYPHSDSIFLDGQVNLDKKPENEFHHALAFDYYVDYFESYKEALVFVAEQRRCL